MRDVLKRWARKLHVIERNIGDYRNVGFDNVCGIPTTEHANFNYSDVNGAVCKVTKGCGSHDVEIRRSHTSKNFDIGNSGYAVCKFLLVNLLAIASDALS